MQSENRYQKMPPFPQEILAHRRSLYTPEQQRIHQELHSDGPVGRAFKKICDAGADPGGLEISLIDLPGFVMRRKHRRWGSRDFRRLDRIVRNLAEAGNELEEFVLLMAFMGLKMEWPVDPLEVPAVLRQLSLCLDATAKSRLAKEWRKKTAYEKIPDLVKTVRKYTGRAHHAEIATLIGAVYKMPSFSADNLKTIELRSRISSKR